MGKCMQERKSKPEGFAFGKCKKNIMEKHASQPTETTHVLAAGPTVAAGHAARACSHRKKTRKG